MEVAKTPYLLVLPCDCPMIGAECQNDCCYLLIANSIHGDSF
jgi:molybdopterin-guanine dinucleotide biosynthesis protein A